MIYGVESKTNFEVHAMNASFVQVKPDKDKIRVGKHME